MEELNNVLSCPGCEEPYQENDKFCGHCGFPFEGTDEEKSKFILDKIDHEAEAQQVRKKINQARIVLFVIAGFTFLQAFFIYSLNEDITLFFVNLFLALLYLGFGFWAKKKAFPAILTGSLVYISVILFSAFIDPMTIVKGLLLKIVFIVAFIKAAYGAYKFRI